MQATKKKGSLGCLSAESDANLFHAILLAELLDTTGGVNGLLLAGVEGVALRAHFNVQVFGHGGAGFESKTTAAVHVDFVVVWVGFRFHDSNPCLLLGLLALSAAKNGAIIHDASWFGKAFVVNKSEWPGAGQIKPFCVSSLFR